MALVKLPESPNEFSLDNGTPPTVILWAQASAPVMAKYKADRSSIITAGKRKGTITPKQNLQLNELAVTFVLNRIVGVRDWEDEEPDKSVVTLEWPKDQARIVSCFYHKVAAGLRELFLSQVLGVHFPEDIETYYELQSASDDEGEEGQEEGHPNS